ncbi:mitochondrial distribution and morphology proteins-domain-containing protein [Xylariaceae sp. FL0804]|nr:mitochondrial distribution and morphology proteins-domain-containing protein [Xylariaceae sp. FL0804]
MSTARSTLTWPGRHVWRCFFDSVDALSSRLSPSRNVANRLGLGQSASYHATPYFRSPRIPRAYHYNARRTFASGGLLLITTNTSSPATGAVVSTCSAAAESATNPSAAHAATLTKLAKQAWAREIHTSRRRATGVPRRTKTSKSAGQKGEASTSQPKAPPGPASTQDPGASPGSKAPASETSRARYFQLPSLHVPHLPHRPTKEEFLAAANGFGERLKVRFKWLSIRSMRPWNADEWGAFVSWFLFGHLVWILVGTTTFFSLIIISINTVFAQETLARWVGDHLTESAGVTVIFESAIVPRWKDGVIAFRNVSVSRRPGQIKSSVSKGSSTNAAAAVAAGRGSDKDVQAVEEDEGNYTQFDVTLNTVNVTLSFVKWWNGEGPLKDVEIKGIRGVIDRTHVKWSDEFVDPLSFRHEHQPGDFEINSFKMEDLLVTIHQPGGFRPFSVSIYSCELPQLRKQYLFYDFLSANHMSGSYDGSLFTIHPRQVHGVAAGQETAVDPLGELDAWDKFSRLRIDGLKIDHLNRSVEGPFGWIYEGNVDIVADVRFPRADDDSITKVVGELYDRLEDAVTSNRYIRMLDMPSRTRADEILFNAPNPMQSADVPDESDPATPPAEPPAEDSAAAALPATPSADAEPPRYLVMDLRIHLNDVKATVPVFRSDLSYVNQALVRPIVAYINAKRTCIPISCRVVKRAADFDGAWTLFDCGLLDDVSAEVYAAFARDVEDQQSRARRFKKVGFWTLSIAVHALFMGMAGSVV